MGAFRSHPVDPHRPEDVLEGLFADVFERKVTVAGGLDDAAPVLGNFRIGQLGAERLEAAERPFLVGFDQARIAGDVGREDRREPTFNASLPCRLHGTSPMADDPTPTSIRHALSTMLQTNAAQEGEGAASRG